MQTHKKRNVDVRVVSMIDMSTFLKIFFVHVFPHELNILQWSISSNYKKERHQLLQVMDVALKENLVEYLLRAFRLIKVRFIQIKENRFSQF